MSKPDGSDRNLRADNHLHLRIEVRISSEAAMSLAPAASKTAMPFGNFESVQQKSPCPTCAARLPARVKCSASHCPRVAFRAGSLLPVGSNQAARVES